MSYSLNLQMLQVDMKNIDEPIQPASMTPMITLDRGKFNWRRYELAINEFTSHEDYVGLFEDDPEPFKFLTYEREYVPPIIPRVIDEEKGIFAGAVLELAFSNARYEHERRFYTLMTLIGDFGGF